MSDSEATSLTHDPATRTGVDVADRQRLARDLAEAGHRLARLGLSPGSSGNVSVRCHDVILMSPTGSDLGALDPESLSVLARDGTHLTGARPSKEVPLHIALYAKNPGVGAVVHVHSTNAVAASCLNPWNAYSALPPLTPYFVMRAGQTPLVPYAPPGSPELAEALASLPFPFRCALLANHGQIASGTSLAAAVAAAIEIEELARVRMLCASHEFHPLTDNQAADLAAKWATDWTID